MPHAIWKGAITFGLVHVPVNLYSATQDVSVDFDWLDKRTLDPVGYKRNNKVTGKDIEKENVVKGIKQNNNEYILLSEEEIKAAFPKKTQTIEIESFVKASEINFMYLEQPYYLEPGVKADKVYSLLREAMKESDVIGVARIILHTKEHLAALIPNEAGLVLNTIRWSTEIRSVQEIKLPEAGRKDLKPTELKMANQLISDMTNKWKPSEYLDAFGQSIQTLVDKKIKAGQSKAVTSLEEASNDDDANVLDLTELLARSLAKRK